ncbi:MAG: hypothetical protein KC431_02320, partial [Myxococcales bacterium]|nr:hypothetical protein [Myxococcales bacterium]
MSHTALSRSKLLQGTLPLALLVSACVHERADLSTPVANDPDIVFDAGVDSSSIAATPSGEVDALLPGAAHYRATLAEDGSVEVLVLSDTDGSLARLLLR